MRYLSIFLILTFSTISCGIINNENQVNPELFGVWYIMDSQDSGIQGWSVTTESVWTESALGSLSPIGIKTDEGTIALINTRYKPDIHYFDSEMIILDYFAHPNVVRDTITYHISGNQLTLESRYYNGTFLRTSLGAHLLEPMVSELVVSINGVESKNVSITQKPPSAYIRQISSNEIRIVSTMSGQSLTITIPDFQGAGTYVIGKEQGRYYRFGTDWLTPDYLSHLDSSGTITIDQFNAANKRYSGHFEFIASVDADPNPEGNSLIEFTNGVFDLPVVEK